MLRPVRAPLRRTVRARVTIGDARALPAYRLAGALELALAAVLLIPPAFVLESAAAAVLGAGFLAYLAWIRMRHPLADRSFEMPLERRRRGTHME